MMTLSRKLVANGIAWVLVLAVLAVAARAHDHLEGIEDLPREARLALFEAQQAIEAGELDKAVDVLQKYLDDAGITGDHYLMQFHLANSLLNAGSRAEAIEHYSRAVDLEPLHAESWLNLGEAAYAEGRYSLAATALLTGYRTSDDKRPELLYFAAASYIMDGSPASAIPILQDLTSMEGVEPKFEWNRALVAACVEAKDSEAGKKAVEDMLAVHGANPDAWLLAFQYGASVGDYQYAAIMLTVTSYLRPLTRQEEMQLGDLYAAISVPAVASEHYEAAMGDSASAREVERLASAYIASYDKERAREVLERAVEKAPTYRLWSLLGDLHFMEKRYEASLAAFQRCAELNPEAGRSRLMMAYCAYELGRNQDAVRYCQQAGGYADYADRADQLLKRLRSSS